VSDVFVSKSPKVVTVNPAERGTQESSCEFHFKFHRVGKIGNGKQTTDNAG